MRPAVSDRLNCWLRLALLWPILLTLCGCGAAKQTFAPVDIDGEKIDAQGQLLLINYWAQWCAPCREEIPELNHFAREQQGRVTVTGVNFDQLPAAQIRAQAEKLGIAFPTLARDPAAHWGQPRPQVLPSTLLIDGAGRWRATLTGPQTRESLQAAISAINKPQPNQTAKH